MPMPATSPNSSPAARLKTVLGRGLPPVPANPAQIRQVVMNLVINAAEAIGEGVGVIEVATSKLAMGRSDLSTGTERLAAGDYEDAMYYQKAMAGL